VYICGDALETQRHVSDLPLDHRATSDNERMGCASEIELKCAFNSEHYDLIRHSN